MTFASGVAGRAGGAERPAGPTITILFAVILAAWALCGWAEWSGVAASFHHHALYESGRPFWISAALMLCAWQAMTAAMMLPSSLGFIRMYAAAAKNAPEFPIALACFLASYFAVWSAFALLAFAGDMQVHRAVDAWPWLDAHQQLVLAGTLGLAAAYQLTPLKDACLRACRHPGMYLARHYRRGALNGFAIGLGHALFCLGCCWALMLVMFAAGVAHLAWMGALGVVMLVEKGARNGDRLVAPVGVAFAVLAVIALVAPHAIPGL
jgi:predicted metal-binding membrane protein